ncbi:hypothetical protein ISS37_03905 [candidate division KSB1 bacterium]|nr:hypothetical protein [candidate division KSB1 bacterium]
MEDIHIGCICANDSPFVGRIIGALLSSGLSVDTIIFDSKNFGIHGLQLFEERTGGKMPLISIDEFDEYKIPCFFVKNFNSSVAISIVRSFNLDILINAGTARILRKDIINAPKIGVLNCHPGLLPDFRGCTCVEWAVFLDERIGNTVHFMNERIDEGPIILKEALCFSKNDLYPDVRTKVLLDGIQLIAKAVRKILKENVTPTTLAKQGTGRYFDVIDDNKMICVIDKLKRGKYRYQL